MEIRSAILAGANSTLLDDKPSVIDQGAGVVDVEAALAALQSGAYVPLEKGAESSTLKGNLASLGFKIIRVDDSGYSKRIENLVAAQVDHNFIESKEGDTFDITLSNFVMGDPQNPVLGDSIFIEISGIETYLGPLVSSVINSDRTYSVTPGEGIFRIGVMGRFINASPISVDLDIQKSVSPPIAPVASGAVAQNEVMTQQVTIPEGTAAAVFILSWNNDWSKYPTDDLDFFATAPSSEPCDIYNEYENCAPLSGGTFGSPEVIVIFAPEPGEWNVYVHGFTVWGIHGGDTSKYKVELLLF